MAFQLLYLALQIKGYFIVSWAPDNSFSMVFSLVQLQNTPLCASTDYTDVFRQTISSDKNKSFLNLLLYFFLTLSPFSDTGDMPFTDWD